MKTPSFCQLLRTCSYQSWWSRTELPCQFHHQSQAEACHSEFHAIPHHGKNKSYRENYGFLWQMAKTAVSSWPEMPLPKAQNGVRQKTPCDNLHERLQGRLTWQPLLFRIEMPSWNAVPYSSHLAQALPQRQPSLGSWKCLHLGLQLSLWFYISIARK